MPSKNQCFKAQTGTVLGLPRSSLFIRLHLNVAFFIFGDLDGFVCSMLFATFELTRPLLIGTFKKEREKRFEGE